MHPLLIHIPWVSGHVVHTTPQVHNRVVAKDFIIDLLILVQVYISISPNRKLFSSFPRAVNLQIWLSSVLEHNG